MMPQQRTLMPPERILLLLLALLLVALLVACETSEADEQATSVSTRVAEQEVDLSDVTPFTHVPVPAMQATVGMTVVRPTNTPAGPGEGCVYDAALVAGVTVQEGGSLAPGSTFIHTWHLANTGTCDWEEGSVLFFAEGDQLGTGQVVAVPPTPAGGTTEVSIALTVPEEPGEYTGLWRLRMADGTELETVFPVSIMVQPAGSTPTLPTATPTPAPAATAAPPQTATPPPPTPEPTAEPTDESGWFGQYYNNPDLVGEPLETRIDPVIDFDWGLGAPFPRLPSNNFSVRWTQTLPFEEGRYRFFALSDDGVRVWVDNVLIVDEWHRVTADTYTADYFLPAGNHDIRVEYFENFQLAQVRFWWEPLSGLAGWRGEYYANPFLSGSPQLVRDDPDVAFHWGLDAPAAGLPRDRFSVRWTREQYFPAGRYEFHALVDDGMRLFVNDTLVIDAWQQGSVRQVNGAITLDEGNHALLVEYFENDLDASIMLWWDNGGAFPDWRGEYWDNASFDGLPVIVRNDPAVNFRWEFEPPDPRLPADNFSIRWSRQENVPAGTYRFSMNAAGPVRVFVDGEIIIDRWFEDDSGQTLTAERSLSGQHSIVILYRDTSGLASVQFSMEQVGP